MRNQVSGEARAHAPSVGLICVGAGIGASLGAIYGQSVFDVAFIVTICSAVGGLLSALLLSRVRSDS
jgi:hypothetical protein